MKKLLILLITCMLIFSFAVPTDAATQIFVRKAYIGSSESVDTIAYATINDGDLCIVGTGAIVYSIHRYESSSSAAENSPWVIKPDAAGAGDGRWELIEDNMIKKVVPWSVVDSDTAVTTGDGVATLTIPASMNGMNLVDVICSVHTKGITGATEVQVRRRRAGADVNVLSTEITIGDEFFATDEVINTSNDDVNTGDQYYLDIEVIHSGTAPNGLGCVLDFQVP